MTDTVVKVENLVVGAPCGAMDQLTSALGQAGALLALRCQPAEMLDPVAAPPSVRLWGIDSGIRHRWHSCASHSCDAVLLFVVTRTLTIQCPCYPTCSQCMWACSGAEFCPAAAWGAWTMAQ